MKEDKPVEPLFGADRPILDEAEDKLGYSEPAKHVAKSILEFASPDGFVLGLEGRWGSGKSSFVNLISESLTAAQGAPEIVHFSPWLIRSQEGMLVELFGELAVAASKIELSDPQDVKPLSRVQRVQAYFEFGKDRRTRDSYRLAKRIQSFSGYLNRLSALAKVAAWANVPGAAIAADGAGVASNATGAWGGGRTLDKEKSALQAELTRLTRKIVIFVDDLDRLSPDEAGEVVRLVRAVADFPNVVYVLCYSREILGQSLKEAYRLEESGESYIDKIVQVSFAVPKPEDFDLRRMLRSEVAALFPNEFSGNDPKSLDRQQRLGSVIDLEGQLTLRTPRDVVRAVNAMILYAGPVLEHIDLADMMWLQLVRVRNQKLYAWIENYANSWAVISQGAYLKDSGRDAVRKELYSLLEEEGRDKDDTVYHLMELLPGIERDYNHNAEGENWKFFSSEGDQELHRLVRDKRIGSPEHFRFYFALSKPKGAIGDGRFETFLKLSESSPDQAKDKLLELATVKRNQGGVVAESLLDRLSLGIEILEQKQLPGLLSTLANSMDDLARKTGAGDWGRYWVWGTAERIYEASIGRIDQKQRTELLKSMFGTGNSIGWLSTLLRTELFSHGVTGDRAKREEERVLQSDELSLVIDVLTTRYASLTMEELGRYPGAANALYAWLQSGEAGEAEVRQWVSAQTKSDEGLLSFLESIRSWRATNDQVSYPLYVSTIAQFINAEDAENRLHVIADAGGDNNAHASELLAALSKDRDF